MDIIIKHYNELSKDELLQILKLRISVFVVEQNCPYQEIDEYDTLSYHIYLKNESGIQGYLRVLPQNTKFKNASIGRVIAVQRRCGLGSLILSHGIETAKERLGATAITIEAQCYAKGLYEKFGFVRTSQEFLEDGIPHIRMELQLK